MRDLITRFDKLFPVYSSVAFNGCCTVEEKENRKADAFLKLEINGINGYEISNCVAKDSTSFFSKAGSGEPLNHDCDGIFFVEYDNKKYLFLCELKSTFATKEIIKAKEQLVGSYLKMHSLLSLLQGYKQDEIEVRGLIASFQPETERLLFIEKRREIDKSCHFCSFLNKEHKYMMPKASCEKFYAPLCVPDFTIYYVGVPDHRQEYAINFNSLLDKE